MRAGPPDNEEYKFKVFHLKSCGFGATTWNLAVIINGKLIQNERGLSDKGNRKKVLQGSFMYKDASF